MPKKKKKMRRNVYPSKRKKLREIAFIQFLKPENLMSKRQEKISDITPGNMQKIKVSF